MTSVIVKEDCVERTGGLQETPVCFIPKVNIDNYIMPGILSYLSVE